MCSILWQIMRIVQKAIEFYERENVAIALYCGDYVRNDSESKDNMHHVF